jgi:hypothetical protein
MVPCRVQLLDGTDYEVDLDVSRVVELEYLCIVRSELRQTLANVMQ